MLAHSARGNDFVAATQTFDLIVIGCGRLAKKPRKPYFGKRVVVIERAEHVGGSCINTGTCKQDLRESAFIFQG